MNLSEAFCKKDLTLIGYLPAGFPDELEYHVCAGIMAKAGFRVLEIGMPDELAGMDGKIIEAAMKRIVERGVNFGTALKLGSAAAEEFGLAAVGMLYYAMYERMGKVVCFELFEKAGIRAILVPDLPQAERKAFAAEARRRGIAVVGFIPIRAGMDEAKEIIEKSEGFLYYQSYDGKTGKAFKPSRESMARFSEIKAMGVARGIPIAIGFGIRNKNDLDVVRKMGGDGAIIGSAIVAAAEKGKAYFEGFVANLR